MRRVLDSHRLPCGLADSQRSNSCPVHEDRPPHQDGVASVKGQWRYHDVKIIEVDGKSKDGSANRTYSYEPKAKGPEFDDRDWEVIEPETLKNARGNGQICFCWYRIKVTIPPEAEGKSVFFQTTVDDYGEVWVDGKLPRKPGDTGGPIVAGFNVPNRVELQGPGPGRSTRSPSSASTDRSPTLPPTGSSSAPRFWSWLTRSEQPASQVKGDAKTFLLTGSARRGMYAPSDCRHTPRGGGACRTPSIEGCPVPRPA